MAARQAPLLHRRRGERREADHVAGRVDVRDGRLEELVDRDPAPVVGRETRGRQVEQVRVGLAADGVEQRVAVDFLAALETRDDALPVVVPDRDDLLAEPERRAALAHEVHQRFDHLAVDEVEDARPRLDHRDLDVEGGHHRRVLEADDAGADDDQVARQRLALRGAGPSR